MKTQRNTRFAALALAATAAFASPVFAQQTDGALSRADVNAQAVAAMKAGEIVSGEGRPQGPESMAASTKTREERKAEAMQARRNGEFPVGGMGTYKTSLSQQTATAKSTKTRAERKSETMQAIKAHQTMQPGEAA
jgi:hypothetical protein